MTSFQIVDRLKSEGHYFAAGAAARSYGHTSSYGCHLGMRSTRDFAIPSRSAMKTRQASFAAPSTGGAVKRKCSTPSV